MKTYFSLKIVVHYGYVVVSRGLFVRYSKQQKPI